MKASLKKSYTLLHQRCRIQPFHHLLQNTLLRLAFSMPPIGKGMEVDDDMEPFPIHVSLVDTPAAHTLFEGHKWGWYCIDRRAAVSQNHNELSFKKWMDHPKPFLHRHIPTLSPSQTFDNCYSTINIKVYEGGRYSSVGIWIEAGIFNASKREGDGG